VELRHFNIQKPKMAELAYEEGHKIVERSEGLADWTQHHLSGSTRNLPKSYHSSRSQKNASPSRVSEFCSMLVPYRVCLSSNHFCSTFNNKSCEIVHEHRRQASCTLSFFNDYNIYLNSRRRFMLRLVYRCWCPKSVASGRSCHRPTRSRFFLVSEQMLSW
jgi:hypothetical protein